MHTMHDEENNLQSNWSIIFGQAKNSNCLEQEISITKIKQTEQTMCAWQNNLHSNWSRIFGQAQNSNCLKQKISVMKLNRQCTPCMPNKTICNSINQIYICTSSKFQLPWAIFFSITNNTDSAELVCLTKQSANQLIKNI